MRIIVIDGQGGGVGRALITAIRQADIQAEIIAAGTSAIATAAMVKAGADAGASGENAIIYNTGHCKAGDVITGPIGILLANAMYGEISPAMAAAVSASEAVKVLVPSNRCALYVTGVENRTISDHVADAVKRIAALAQQRCTK